MNDDPLSIRYKKKPGRRTLSATAMAVPLVLGQMDSFLDSLPEPDVDLPCAVAACVTETVDHDEVEQEHIRPCSPWKLTDLRYGQQSWSGLRYTDMECLGVRSEYMEDGTYLRLFRKEHLDGSWCDYRHRAEVLLFQNSDRSLEFSGQIIGPIAFGSYHVLKIRISDSIANRFHRYCDDAGVQPFRWYCRCGEHNERMDYLANNWFIQHNKVNGVLTAEDMEELFVREPQRRFGLPSVEEDPNAYFRLMTREHRKFTAEMKEWSQET